MERKQIGWDGNNAAAAGNGVHKGCQKHPQTNQQDDPQRETVYRKIHKK